MSRFDVHIDRDVIVDNLTKKEYEIPYDEVNFALWNIIRDLSDENEQLLKEKEYYRKYALLYFQKFDLYSDAFIETIKSIEGEEFANKMKKDRDEIIKALKMEGLWNE